MFKDRRQAGTELAKALAAYQARPDVIVLGLPRGGVPVAAEVARGLEVPLDVFIVRKLGAPGQPELAMGAVASGGTRILNEDVLRLLNVSAADLAATTAWELREIARREVAFRGGRPPLTVSGQTVLLVDDGLATGATLLAAVKALRLQKPKAIIAAVPVGDPGVCRRVANEVDELICLEQPTGFSCVGAAYDDFDQTTDDEVKAALTATRQPLGHSTIEDCRTVSPH